MQLKLMLDYLLSQTCFISIQYIKKKKTGNMVWVEYFSIIIYE